MNNRPQGGNPPTHRPQPNARTAGHRTTPSELRITAIRIQATARGTKCEREFLPSQPNPPGSSNPPPNAGTNAPQGRTAMPTRCLGPRLTQERSLEPSARRAEAEPGITAFDATNPVESSSRRIAWPVGSVGWRFSSRYLTESPIQSVQPCETIATRRRRAKPEE